MFVCVPECGPVSVEAWCEQMCEWLWVSMSSIFCEHASRRRNFSVTVFCTLLSFLFSLMVRAIVLCYPHRLFFLETFQIKEIVIKNICTWAGRKMGKDKACHLHQETFPDSPGWASQCLARNSLGQGFPGGPAVQNLRANAGYMGSVSGLGRSHKQHGD